MQRPPSRILDGFSSSFLPKAADAGISVPTVNRHIGVLRRCVGTRDRAVLVAKCARAARSGAPANELLVITQTRLVVTSESRFLRRLRLHLNAGLRQLADVTWTTEPANGAVRFAATAIDGVREHFVIDVGGSEEVRRLDSLLRRTFRRTLGVAA